MERYGSGTVTGSDEAVLVKGIWDLSTSWPSASIQFGHIRYGTYLAFQTYHDTDSSIHTDMVIKTGKIGIRTTNPTHPLTVNGAIRAKEIIVDSGWADRVFDEELMPLSEVERHIKAYKHLPGIPTEEEILKNGLSIGDMQAKQMGEIEKIVRYLIELKKENDQLKERIFALESLLQDTQ